MKEKLKAAAGLIQAYKNNSSVALREARCLDALYPGVLEPLRPGDVFAGRVLPIQGSPIPFDFSNQKSNMSGYSMNRDTVNGLRKEYPEDAELINDMESFFLRETTFMKFRKEALSKGDAVSRYISRFCRHLDSDGYAELDPDTKKGEGDFIIHLGTRISGITLDYKKLVDKGINGLEDWIKQKMSGADEKGKELYEAMLISLGTVRKCALYYEKQARDLYKKNGDAESLRTALALEKIQKRAPETFFEAIQLFWLYSVLCRAGDYGRLDETLGTFLCKDIDSGVITGEDAISYLLGLYKCCDETGFKWNERIILGGKNRVNEADADRFAILAMEATRRFKKIMPVLTLRFYKGQNKALTDKALEVIGQGALYPTLYNDDVYINGAEKILGVRPDDACDYIPLGCGELMISKKSVGSPCSAINICKALEAALHNGRCAVSGDLIGLQTGELSSLDTFDKLFDALKKQITYGLETDAVTQKLILESTKNEAAFVLQSILSDDCVEKGRALLDGGIRYLGGCAEGFGQVNTSDSLAAIKKLVYEDKVLTLNGLVKILDDNFVGHERERKLMLDCPKFGNNDTYVDSIHLYIDDFINKTAQKAGKKAGLDYYIVSNVNPNGIKHGAQTAASADGRLCGEAFAIGNSPSPGSDKNGFTSMLASVAKTSAENGGYITNIKLSPEFAVDNKELLEKLLGVFFESGGAQLNITVVNQNDLLLAQKHPENYGHVLVRVGGYSARFVDLSPVFQKHIIERAIY